VGSQCGAKKKHGTTTCSLAAGWGTSHPGTGRCKFHGGSTPNHVKAAASDEYRKLLGTTKDINPVDAIIWCIKIRAGEVEWLTQRMQELDEKAWIEETLVGKQFHLYARERSAAMGELVKFSNIALSLGLAEKAIRLAEQYGNTIARLLEGILTDLMPHLSDEGKALAPQIVRRHLILIEGGNDNPPVAKEGQRALDRAAAA
jgi:hypothetical protein